MMKSKLFYLLLGSVLIISSCSTFNMTLLNQLPLNRFEKKSTEKVQLKQTSSQQYSIKATVATIRRKEDIEEDVVYPDEEELTTDEGLNAEIPEVRISLPLPFPYPLRKIQFDFPVTYNTEVEGWIKYFTGKGRGHFEKWLNRMFIYIDYIKSEFRKSGLPVDLAYLPLIESGFNVRAISPAWAVGMWQFMASTGRKYGLRINYWIDERRDPWKSTHAAIKYLKDLYSMFNDWSLAIAAYNAGEGKIKRAIKRYGTFDFWILKNHRYIRRETANYVPKFIAALLIAKCPVCFGFNIRDVETLDVERVKLPFPVDLYLVSQITGVPLKKLLFLNPELRHWITPPDYPGYQLKLPPGKGKILIAGLEKFGKSNIAKRYKRYSKLQRERAFVVHRMRWGETLSHVARRYRVSVRTLMRINRIRSPRRIRAGRKIFVPIVRGRTLMYYTGGKYYVPSKSYHRSKLDKGKNRLIKYRVKAGDSLWSIARRFGVSVSKLKRWNGIRGNFIRVGEILYVKRPSYRNYAGNGNTITYRVREGDTLWDISRKFGVSISNIKTIKKKYPGNSLYPGDVLLIKKD